MTMRIILEENTVGTKTKNVRFSVAGMYEKQPNFAPKISESDFLGTKNIQLSIPPFMSFSDRGNTQQQRDFFL